MNRRVNFASLAVVLAFGAAPAGAQVVKTPAPSGAPASAVPAAKLSGQPTKAEQPFVNEITTFLNAHFDSIGQAEAAGYMRYTNEDDTGAISYANRKWTSTDADHPSQLWYDVHGHLLGADYSVPYDAAQRPQKFGLDPARWEKFGKHDHYGLVGPNGTTIYGATSAKKLEAIGANSNDPTPADLVKLGIAKKPSDVRFVWVFPAIWDVSIWVDGNPDGAFAYKNPNVKPVNPPKNGDEM